MISYQLRSFLTDTLIVNERKGRKGFTHFVAGAILRIHIEHHNHMTAKRRFLFDVYKPDFQILNNLDASMLGASENQLGVVMILEFGESKPKPSRIPLHPDYLPNAIIRIMYIM